jgi:hypothetical protein
MGLSIFRISHLPHVFFMSHPSHLPVIILIKISNYKTPGFVMLSILLVFRQLVPNNILNVLKPQIMFFS